MRRDHLHAVGIAIFVSHLGIITTQLAAEEQRIATRVDAASTIQTSCNPPGIQLHLWSSDMLRLPGTQEPAASAASDQELTVRVGLGNVSTEPIRVANRWARMVNLHLIHGTEMPDPFNERQEPEFEAKRRTWFLQRQAQGEITPLEEGTSALLQPGTGVSVPVRVKVGVQGTYSLLATIPSAVLSDVSSPGERRDGVLSQEAVKLVIHGDAGQEAEEIRLEGLVRRARNAAASNDAAAIALSEEALALPGSEREDLLITYGYSLYSVGRHADALGAFQRALKACTRGNRKPCPSREWLTDAVTAIREGCNLPGPY